MLFIFGFYWIPEYECRFADAGVISTVVLVPGVLMTGSSSVSKVSYVLSYFSFLLALCLIPEQGKAWHGRYSQHLIDAICIMVSCGTGFCGQDVFPVGIDL